MVTKTCECGISFSYEPNPNFPDKRKYCDKCSAEKKASYEARQKPQIGASPEETAVRYFDGKTIEKVCTIPNEIAKETGTFQSTVWNHSVSANSYEIGSAGNRFKLYFESVDELKIKIAELKLAGLITDEIEIQKL